MASNQLPEGARKKIFREIDKLFGRPLLAYACPLSFEERVALARCNCTPEEIEAIRRLMGFGMFMVSERIHMLVGGKIENAAPQTSYSLRSDDCPDGVRDNMFAGVKNTSVETSRLKIYERLGLEVAGKFFYWLDTAMDLSMEIEAARITVQEVMTMAKTPGHLRRMVPELYKLAYHFDHAQGGRTSTAPYEWAAYPRQRVVALTDTMAKLMLLKVQPDGDSTEALWSTRDQFTWPINRI